MPLDMAALHAAVARLRQPSPEVEQLVPLRPPPHRPEDLVQLGPLGRRSASRTEQLGPVTGARGGPPATRQPSPVSASWPAAGAREPQAILTTSSLPAPLLGPEQPEQLALAQLQIDLAKRLRGPRSAC